MNQTRRLTQSEHKPDPHEFISWVNQTRWLRLVLKTTRAVAENAGKPTRNQKLVEQLTRATPRRCLFTPGLKTGPVHEAHDWPDSAIRANQEIGVLKYMLRLFGSGRLPPEGRRVVEAEHCRLLAESMVGSMAARNARNARQFESKRGRWFLGSLAISDKRVLVYRYGSCLLNVRFDDHRMRSLDFSAESPGVLSIEYDLSLFHPMSSGEAEICFWSTEALRICTTMASHVRRFGGRQSIRGPAR